MRFDSYLAFSGRVKTRNKAKVLIETGCVSIGSVVIKKPSYQIDEKASNDIKINTNAMPYVSRGGLKLKMAFDTFPISAEGKICADIGASTGGFTDCMLRHRAKKIYAIDSGTNQLDPDIAADPRVISIEGFNARYLSRDSIDDLCGFAAADLSFISQTYVIKGISEILEYSGEYIGLIKPQFECGKESVGKNGIVRDTKHHSAAIRRVINAVLDSGFSVLGLVRSPIKGGDGNTEFLLYAKKTGVSVQNMVTDEIIKSTVLDSG